MPNSLARTVRTLRFVDDVEQQLKPIERERVARIEESVRFQAHLLDAVEQAVIATDREGTVTSWNRSAEMLYGWTAGEALGRNIIALTPAETTAEQAREIFEQLRDGKSWSGEFLVRGKDGASFPVHVTDSPILDEAGNVIGVVGVSVNISGRRRAEEALKESEAFFRAAFVSSAVASVLSSPEGTIIRSNRAFGEMLQFSDDELCGRNILDLAHPGDVIRLQAMRERLLAGETEFEQFDRTFVRRDGQLVHGLASVALIRRADGEPLYFTSQVIDISDRKRAEAAVGQREEYLAGIIAIQQEIGTAALDVMTVMRLVAERARTLTRSDGAIVEMVDGDELIYHTDSGTPEEYSGLRIPLKGSLSGLCVEQRVMLVSPDMWSDPRVNQDVARRIGARSGLAVPLMYDGRVVGVLKVHANQPARFSESDERTLQLLAGVAAAALSHAADYAAKQALVAERTVALDALREREAHFRTLIENAADPILIVNERMMVTYASPAIKRLSGMSPESVLGMNALGFVHPDDLERVRESFVRLMDAPVEGSMTEMRTKHTDGSWRTVKSRGRNLFADPAVGAIVLNLTDVTNEKLLAQQLRQSQKLEAVGQLAGGVAHDFNNLLTVIQVHGELLSADLDSRDPRHADVGEISKAAARAAGLTRQLLAFSRQQLLQPKVLCVNTVVASITPMLRRLIGEDIQITTIPGDGELRALADQGQLEQVLMNLVINARDAMPRGGSIVIESRIVALDDGFADGHDIVAGGRYVMLSVADTGTGMDRQTRDRIFEPFFTTKEPGQGTGLGLSTVYGIVKQSNGHVWVYSEPGLGTTFKVYLPLATDEVTRESGAVTMIVPSGSETVLLVEDDDAVRVLTRRILLKQGYQVIEANHGADGLSVAAAYDGRIDIVVTDVVMPQMNGRELVERLTSARPAIRVLYLSGYANDDILRRSSLDSDSHAMLQKPFTTAALAQAVRSVLDAPDPPDAVAA